MSIQQWLDLIAHRHIDITEHDGTRPRVAERPAVAHRRLPGHKLGLAKRTLRFRAVLAIHRMAFGKNGGHSIVPTIEVGGEFGHEISIPLRSQR
ncbi:MAG: hypothetical protein VX075_06000 [Pseudomonadota bacterium]|nr:hypothetical protein [Pseudomonadota bacterium]